MVKHFHEHLRAISEPRLLDLIYLSDARPITNEDASRLLGIARTGAWRWLSTAAHLGLLEKRGHAYRISDYARQLIAIQSLAFRGIVRGGLPETNPKIPQEVIGYAREGVEAQYERGRITLEEYNRRLKLIHDLEPSLGHATG